MPAPFLSGEARTVGGCRGLPVNAAKSPLNTLAPHQAGGNIPNDFGGVLRIVRSAGFITGPNRANSRLARYAVMRHRGIIRRFCPSGDLEICHAATVIPSLEPELNGLKEAFHIRHCRCKAQGAGPMIVSVAATFTTCRSVPATPGTVS